MRDDCRRPLCDDRAPAIIESAPPGVSQGFCMFGADGRLILCNRHCAEMLALPRELATPGARLADIGAHMMAIGLVTEDNARAYAAKWMAQAEQKAEFGSILELTDGRVYSLSHAPTPEGAWISTWREMVETPTQNESALRRARALNQLLLEAFEAAPEGLALLDERDRFVLWNGRYEELYVESSGPFAGMSFQERLRVGGAIGSENASVAEDLALRATHERRREQQLAGGRWVRIDERRTRDGGSVGVRIDITELKRQQDSFRLLFDSNPVPMWVYDRESLNFLAVNDAAIEHYGYSREEFLAMTVLDIRPEEDRELARHAAPAVADASQKGGAWRHRKADGEEIWVAKYARSIAYEGRNGQLVCAIDITQQRQAEERIAHLARHDPLTNLPNRAAFNERLESTLKRAAGSGAQVALMCIDVDHLKEVNEVFGHDVGDQLLLEISRRLLIVAGDYFLGRLEGDEFLLIAEGFERIASVAALVERLLGTVSRDVEINGVNITAGVSVGVAMFPEDGRDPATLLANAHAAHYRAKEEGRGVARFFRSDMDRRLRERHAMRQDLSSAIERGELALFYQPQTEVGGAIVGFEALLRWRHPVRGLVPPSAFIPVAEDSRLIVKIGEWVLREVCREAASWPRPLSVAINLSPVQFQYQHGDLPSLVHSILLESGLSANRLELEITEGVLIADTSRALSVLRKLKALGVRMAMDDFGTGYSSLSYLQSFPFDYIKIDRAFITNVPQNGQSAAIVRAVLGLARGLGLRVIAEGVETAAEYAFLAEEACDFAQGYLIGRPLPIADYAEIVGRPSATSAMRRRQGG